jgi:hypothetical protein
MAKPIRRIVTGHNANGRSVIIMDGPAPDVLASPVSPKVVGTLLWRTDRSPASNRGSEDMAPSGLRVPTPPQEKGGSVFRITEIPPDKEFGDTSNIDMTASGAIASGEGRKRHFLFHKTNTVDYAICLEGRDLGHDGRRRSADEGW